MAKLDRNGVAIHYEVHGPSGGKAPTILLSHGYSSTSRMWDGQIAALKDRYQVVVWDFRGHGESDYPTDGAQYSEPHEQSAHACCASSTWWARRRRSSPACRSAATCRSPSMRAHPDSQVRALDACTRHRPRGFKKDFSEGADEMGTSRHKRAADLDARGLGALNSKRRGSRLTRHRDGQRPRRLGARHARPGQRDRGDPVASTRIAVPTLQHAGRRQRHQFPRRHRLQAAKIKRSTKVVIPDAGHAANLHQPALFNQAVEAFLAKLPIT